MSASTPPTVQRKPPEPPDRDFEQLRAEAMAELQKGAPRWTDHNVHDPGITLMESVLWAVADLHFRTAQVPRGFPAWPSLAAGWRAGPELYGEVDRELVAGLWRDHEEEIRGDVEGASSRPAAIVALQRRFYDEDLNDDAALALVRAVRDRRFWRVALGRSDVVERVLDDAADPGTATAELAGELAGEGLWGEELSELVGLERRRRLSCLFQLGSGIVERSLAEASDLPSATALVVERLVLEGPWSPLTSAEARALIALAPCPRVDPELWELGYGRTVLWPPHPLQARTVEPVTSADYRRLLLAHPEVGRGWVVPGTARGLRWDGNPQTVELPHRQGGLTLLVQPTEAAGGSALLPREPWSTLTAAQRRYLKRILKDTLDGERGVTDVEEPFHDLSRRFGGQAPRRLMGDEVGAALLTACPVIVRATLNVTPDANGALVRERARTLLEGFLSTERIVPGMVTPPSPSDPTCPEELEGPWPIRKGTSWSGALFPVQPPGGWTPGDPVRVYELAQLLHGIRGVVGIEGLAAKTAWAPGAAWEGDELAVGPFCVPVYEHRPCCITARVARREECDD